MHISELKESKYLTQHDCEPAILVTIAGLSKDNLAQEGKPPEYKWCLLFDEVKPLVLNATNIQLLGMIHGEETEGWMGKKVVLFRDPTISYGGKLIGGIRVRAMRTPQQGATPAPAPAPAPEKAADLAAQAEPEFNDDIPW